MPCHVVWVFQLFFPQNLKTWLGRRRVIMLNINEGEKKSERKKNIEGNGKGWSESLRQKP